MVFERKIKIKNGEYWILEHTIRKGKKYIKKIKYLGKFLPPKKRLAQLKKEFLKEIQEKKYKYLSGEDLEKIEKKLGKKGLENMHIHITGIAYGEKGEKHHLNLKESDLKYGELAKAMKDFKVKGVVISESPNIEEDAILMKRAYETL